MMVEADELTGCEDDVVDELRGESLKATDAPDREESLAVDASSSMGASSSSDGCSRAEVSSKDSAAVVGGGTGKNILQAVHKMSFTKSLKKILKIVI